MAGGPAFQVDFRQAALLRRFVGPSNRLPRRQTRQEGTRRWDLSTSPKQAPDRRILFKLLIVKTYFGLPPALGRADGGTSD